MKNQAIHYLALDVHQATIVASMPRNRLRSTGALRITLRTDGLEHHVKCSRGVRRVRLRRS
jgi:hypothetical protein